MKKLIKYFIAMTMAGVTLLPLTSCAFGGSNTALLEMQSKIEQLEKDLAAEKSKTDELIQTVGELNKSIVEQNKNIENINKSKEEILVIKRILSQISCSLSMYIC